MTPITQIPLADRLHISEREWHILAGILQTHLPATTVWAFGSRANGRHIKPTSDLDLAVQGRLEPTQRALLNEALDEALLDFKVDVVELDLLDADFKARIEPDFVTLQHGPDQS